MRKYFTLKISKFTLYPQLLINY